MDESRHRLGPELMTQVNSSTAEHRDNLCLSTNRMTRFKILAYRKTAGILPVTMHFVSSVRLHTIIVSGICSERSLSVLCTRIKMKAQS